MGELNHHVNRCVRYLLANADGKNPISKQNIKKKVLLNAGKHYEEIMTAVKSVLLNVYGYNLLQHEQSAATTYYFIRNSLPYLQELEDEENGVPKDAHKILLMLVLTHIFMCNDKVSEGSLMVFLKGLNIDFHETHNLFGNVKQYINNTLVHQKYIVAIENMGTNSMDYSWGPYAITTVSKYDILQFVCKVHGNFPGDWGDQYKADCSQFDITETG